MKVTYQVDDGYVGKSRPQYARINDQDIIDAGSREDAEQVIHDFIMDHFQNNVIPSYDIGKYTEEIEKLLNQQKP